MSTILLYIFILYCNLIPNKNDAFDLKMRFISSLYNVLSVDQTKPILPFRP